MREGFYWPTILSDTHKKVEAYHKCQIFEGRKKLVSFPLNPIQVEAPFQQWGLDFIREINPHSSGHHRWILNTTDYFTKWIESIPTRQATETVIIQFLEEHTLSRYGVPRKIIIDNASAFKLKKMITFYFKYQI